MGLLRRAMNVLAQHARSSTGSSTGLPAGFAPRPPSSEPVREPSRGSGPTDGVAAQYAPEMDGEPDPGEVVWGWVPYEDDPNQGKDRPVLLLAHDGAEWLALMLSSQDHDRDAADEARWGRYWMDVGTGGWDRERRPSEVRLDRLLRLDDAAIRREGAALPEAVFREVVAEASKYHKLG